MEKPASETLWEQVRLLERKLGILSDIQTSCCRVTLAQCHALVEIGRAGHISLNDLSSLLELDKSTMSRTLQNLVSGGLAVRESDPSDRRYLQISLTEAGIQEFREIERTMNLYFGKVYQRIPEEKRGMVLESIGLLLGAFPDESCCTETTANTREGKA